MAPAGPAAADTFKRKPSAFEYSVFLQRINRIVRTGGRKSALGADHRRNDVLVNFDQ